MGISVLSNIELNGVVSTVGTAVTTGAKFYKGAIDNVYYVGLGALECTNSAAVVIGTVWNRGVAGNVKEIAKSCIGFDHLVKAGKEIRKADTPCCCNGTAVRRPLPARIGTAIGHLTNAATTAVASSAAVGGVVTFAIGETRNRLGMPYSNDAYFAGAQMVATGVNISMNALVSPVLSCARTSASFLGRGLGKSFVFMVMNPSDTVATAVPIIGAGALLYVAACQVENASAAPGKISKVFHATIATAAVTSALLVPGLASAVGITS